MMDRPRLPPPCPARPQVSPRSESPIEDVPKCPPRPSEAPVPSSSVLPRTPPTNISRPTKPPPIPLRPDLGEGSIDKDQLRCEDKSLTEKDLLKHAAALGPKGRPEITSISARPMNSQEDSQPTELHTAPSLTSCAKLTAETNDCEIPQKPVRRARDRDPPPRPKTRPVSELSAFSGEGGCGSVAGVAPQRVAVAEANKVNNRDAVGPDGTAAAALTTELLAPPRKNKQASVIRNEGQNVERVHGNGTRKPSDTVSGANLEHAEPPKLNKRGTSTITRAKQTEEPDCEVVLNSVITVDTDPSNAGKGTQYKAPIRTKKPKPSVIRAEPPKAEDVRQDKSDLTQAQRKPTTILAKPPIAEDERQDKSDLAATQRKPPTILAKPPMAEDVRQDKSDLTQAQRKPTDILAKPPIAEEVRQDKSDLTQAQRKPTTILAKPPIAEEVRQDKSDLAEAQRKPPTILAKPPIAEEVRQDKSDLTESEQKPKPATKPLPPAVKPRPPSIVRPPAGAQEENRKEDTAPSLAKPKSKPTIISTKPVGEAQSEKPKSKPTIISTKPVGEAQSEKSIERHAVNEREMDQQLPAKPPSPSPPIKSKRLPTIIQPKKADSLGSEAGVTADQRVGEQPSPNAGRIPPEKPARVPSIKRPCKPKPPQRPVTVPSVSNMESNTIWYVSLDEGPPGTVKSTDTDRGVESSVGGQKDYENTVAKLTDNGVAEVTRKDSQTGAPLRPAPRQASRKEAENLFATSSAVSGSLKGVTPSLGAAETADNRASQRIRPKPAPPVPSQRSRGEGNESPQESTKPAKSKPSRPASVSDQHGEVSADATAGSAKQGDSHKHDKVKPSVAPRLRRPASQSEPRPAVEEENEYKESPTKADVHVQVTPEPRHEGEVLGDPKSARDQEPAAERQLARTDEQLQQTEKSKTKPPRPASVADKVPDKGLSRGPDILADVKTVVKSKPPRPPASAVKSRPPRPAGRQSKEDETKSSLPKEPTQLSSVCPTKLEPSAIALHDYEPDTPDDLRFEAGDEIILISKVDRDWYVGKCNNQEGLFPVQFVEIIEDVPDDLQSVPDAKRQSGVSDISKSSVTALYDFAGDVANDELVFNAGDAIHVLEKVTDDWLRGKCNGKTGIFPANFVKMAAIHEEQKIALVTGHIDDQNHPPSNVSGPRCTALFDFAAGAAGDLTFRLGDVIELTERINEEWLKGKLNGQTGTFPAAYVEILEDLLPTPTDPVAATNDTVEYVIAQYDYTGGTAEDLSFHKGDKIVVTERVSDEWLKGELRGQQGMFPRGFVGDIAEEKRTRHSSHTQVGIPQARALYDFTGETEQELSFKSGDVIDLLNRVSDDWLKGTRGSHVGQFPASFVEILIPLP